MEGHVVMVTQTLDDHFKQAGGLLFAQHRLRLGKLVRGVEGDDLDEIGHETFAHSKTAALTPGYDLPNKGAHG